MNMMYRSIIGPVALIFSCSGLSQAAVSNGPEAPHLVVQSGHAETVNSLAFSPDGRILVSGGADHTLKLWNVASGRELRTLSGHAASVTSVAFSPDGQTLVSGSADATVKLWDPASGKESRTLAGPAGVVYAVAFSPDGRTVAVGSGHEIKLLNVSGGKEPRTLSNNEGTGISIAFSPDGRTLASGSTKGRVRLWDVASGKELRTVARYANWVDSVTYSPDGQTLAVGTDNQIELLDLTTGKKPRTLAGHAGGVSSVAFSLDGRALASVNRGHAIRLWDVASGKKLHTLTALKAYDFTSVAFSPDGRTLATGSYDTTIRLWDAASGEELRTLAGHASSINSVAFSPDGQTLAAASADRTIKLWDLVSGKNLLTLSGHVAPVELVAFSADGRTLASESSGHAVKLWDVASGKELHTMIGEAANIASIAFSLDGATLAVGSDDGTVKLWDASSGKELRTLVGHATNDFTSMAFSPDDRTLAIASSDETKLWDITSGQELHTLVGHDEDEMIVSVAFSPDGRTLATGDFVGLVKLWDVASGKELRTLEGHTGTVNSVAFSADGRTLASGSSDHSIKLWNVAAGTLLGSVAGDPAGVASVAFSPDGRTLASGSDDGAVRLWRPADGSLRATLVSFIDGRWVVTDPEGRFDAADLEDMPHLHWVIADDPYTPLPLEIFMRDYYEPRLLSRILNGEKLKAVRDLSSLNRVQPLVRIVSAVAVPGQPDAVDLSVEAIGAVRRYQPNLPEVETAAHDLRIFRNGQLAGYSDGMLTRTPREAYRRTFRVRLPAGSPAIHFTAYAFNDDRVKSDNAALDYTPPVSGHTAVAQAYVITVGVDHHENSAWDLRYAGNDARAMSESLIKQLSDQNYYQNIVPIVLISDAAEQLATRSKIQSVLERLAGHSADLAGIPNGERLQAATPDDFVLISFSGHGFDTDGEFYVIPGDTGPGHDKTLTPELLAHAISSTALAYWMRDIDGGDMTMIIDACQSAASVGSEFKPGPMGASGLGQLAYEKGMRILAASQAEESAGESALTQQGLLSYALVHDGLNRGNADFKPRDGQIMLGEWLAYGVLRVPDLANEIASGALDRQGSAAASKGAQSLANPYTRNSTRQRPALFDYAKSRKDVTIATTIASP